MRPTLKGCSQAFSTSFTFSKGICSFQARAVAEEFLTVPKEFFTWVEILSTSHIRLCHQAIVSSKKELFLVRVTCYEFAHAFSPRQSKEVHDQSRHLFWFHTEVLVSENSDRARELDGQSLCRVQVCRESSARHFWFPASWSDSAEFCKRLLSPGVKHPAGVPYQQNNLHRFYLKCQNER